MPSFAELKQKALKAKDASVDKYQKTRDNNTSVSLKSTNWDPYNGRVEPTPPPPPQRKPSALQTFKPPPSRANSTLSTDSGNNESPPPSFPPRNTKGPALPSRASPTDAPRLLGRGGGPPTIERSTKPVKPGGGTLAPPPPTLPRRTGGMPNRTSSSVASSSSSPPTPQLDWSNLTAADKEEFFRWLDEFFSGHLGRRIGSAQT